MFISHILIHGILFPFKRRDHRHKHVFVFFSLLLGESFHTLIYIRCIYDVIFFGIVLILEEVAYYQNALCYIAHHTHHN